MTAKPLSRGERWLLGATSVGAVAVGALGLASSFDAVSGAAVRWGFDAPWMLPAGIDLAIPVFTVAHLLLVRMNMALAWVRAVPWALTGVTCWLNVAAGATVPARIAHGVMPLLWVVLSEIAAHAYAVRIGAATGTRMERVRRSRWLLAPFATLALWRRMVLWETTSYREALARERQRQLVRAELRERYGRAWRRRAPVRTRVLLRLGELSPDGPTAGQDQRPEPEPGPPTARASRSPAELLAQAREITRDWPTDQLTADAIRKAVRTSQHNGRTLRDTLRAERRARLPHPA
ncbi:DUF2637 domain-containing protein [Streptomyces sp. 3MP-14]|uniref:DUF2637 domain-containing protein n=1 Tax=Streptomyces mimosae TaxID=2586635 RepID=A0A5N6AR07_9ACTN|nr:MULTISPECIES: DUF2637 domain-containing protein [Streptomyces]KAB8171121.1 DUF2637 domain-containing protein [Streptomyces mimosae]KAB8179527.1 DUF2637 domain-containing protein [Streptomyces sp. 3MP-14]